MGSSSLIDGHKRLVNKWTGWSPCCRHLPGGREQLQLGFNDMTLSYIPSWLAADNNGGLKLISCKPPSSGEPVNLKEPALKYILDAQIILTATAKPIHRLAAGSHADQNMVYYLVSMIYTYNNIQWSDSHHSGGCHYISLR
jgi:hypothetical protein